MYKEKFMYEAVNMSKYSQDPNTKVGCMIVNEAGKKIGLGYNRMPKRASVDFTWNKIGKLQETKYPYVIHAEMAAFQEGLTSSKGFLNNSLDCYVTMFPCSNCAKLLVELGVKNVYYISDKYADTEDVIASKALLRGCGINYEQKETPDGFKN